MIRPAMASDQVEALKRVPLLADVEERHLERLARSLKERTYNQGAELTTEGGASGNRFFFVIADGNANVSVGGEERAKLGPGDYFGEMALIDEGARTATVVADTDLRCYTLTPWEFRPFVEEHPEVAWTLLRTLMQRLRERDTR
jgi:CRP/FNR family cyclic AMP-dependent transcriptional regulator